MLALRIAFIALICTTGWRAAAQDEVPFVTTPDQVTLAMLELGEVGAGDHVIDLGSGDGRIVITAARRLGASGLGVEIVPDLVQRSRDNARAAGVQERVEFREQDLFATDLGRASVVTMYLLPEVNLQLRPRLLALRPGTRVVSHDWNMGDWQPDRSVTIDVPDKAVGRERVSRVHLWRVPARVHGLWCSAAARLEISQRFQHFSATLVERVDRASGAVPAPGLVFDGRIDTLELRDVSTNGAVFVADADGSRLRGVTGPGRRFSGQVFTRAPGAQCA
jgi:SAM-dependent methyltransferase